MPNQETQSQDKTNKFDGISDALSVETDVTPEVVKPATELDLTATKDQLKKDYEYTRGHLYSCLLYTSPSPRDGLLSRMPSSA